jgi:hypothetical protein
MMAQRKVCVVIPEVVGRFTVCLLLKVKRDGRSRTIRVRDDTPSHSHAD